MKNLYSRECPRDNIDPDSILTKADYEALRQYREEKKKEKLISHQQIRKLLMRKR